MVVQCGRVGRFAASGQIVPAGAYDPSCVSDLSRDQLAVGQLPDADRHVDMGLDENDHLVRQDQPRGDLRIGAKEGMDERRDAELSEHDRRRHQQFAARFAILAACRLSIARTHPVGKRCRVALRDLRFKLAQAGDEHAR